MRLDHLLSTEFFSGRRSGVRRVARVPGMVPGLAWACWCGRDRWLRGSLGPAGSGAGMLLGSRTATRDLWSRAVFRMPLAGRRGPVGLWVGSGRGAWWFENWIVDASNAMM